MWRNGRGRHGCRYGCRYGCWWIAQHVVDVGAPQPAPLDADKVLGNQFFEILDDRARRHFQVTRQQILTGEAILVLPGVAQDEGVGEFGAVGEPANLEQVVGELGEAQAQRLVLDDDGRLVLAWRRGARQAGLGRAISR